MEGDPVELGLELLASIEADEVDLPEAVDRLETITTDPALVREILDEAALRGLLDRERGIVTPRRGQFVRFASEVERREGEFTCRRCGTDIGTGYFLALDPGEIGPFGSSCVRKVTGREE
jgi:hypothetical protein